LGKCNANENIDRKNIEIAQKVIRMCKKYRKKTNAVIIIQIRTWSATFVDRDFKEF